MEEKFQNIEKHFRKPTSLHRRIPSKSENDLLLHKINNTHKSAKLRSVVSKENLDSLHEPIRFSWKQFWVTLFYEILPPVILSPVAVLLIEGSKRKAWNVIQNRVLLVFSLRHNSKGTHIFSWLIFYPSNWLIHISLGLIWFQPEILRNIDAFQVILAFLFLFIRNLIISIKYGYFRPEDYAMLGEDPPKWVEDNTNRRLVGLGWSNPSQYPGLIEDELICAMDETDVSLQGMSFRLEENIAEELRNHSTDELFSAKTEINETNEVTAGFVVHQILSKIYNLSFPKTFPLFTLSIVIFIIGIPLYSRFYFGIPMFGENVHEMIIFITLIIGFFWGIPVFIFGFVCIYDFSRRYISLKELGELIKFPGIPMNEFLYFNNDQDIPKKDKTFPKKDIFIDMNVPENVFSWMNSRKVMRNFGYGFYQRIQGYTSTLLCYAIFCVIILNIIGWMQMRHHLSTLIMLMFAILSLSIICIITIIKASQLQHTSSEHRNMILNDMFLKERNLMEKISDNHQKMRMIKAKTLLKEVDESIHFEELIHNPTKILGYTASPNVISSALGIILTGLVLAMEGFAGSGISYDSNGWFNF